MGRRAAPQKLQKPIHTSKAEPRGAVKCLNFTRDGATSNPNVYKLSVSKPEPRWKTAARKFRIPSTDSSVQSSVSFSHVVANGTAKISTREIPTETRTSRGIFAPNLSRDSHRLYFRATSGLTASTSSSQGSSWSTSIEGPSPAACSSLTTTTIMSVEIDTAVQFLSCLLAKYGRSADIDRFQLALTDAMVRHYDGHWYPTDPLKGSGYRCIRVNGVIHPLLTEAARICKLPVKEMRQAFPSELTIWVDPGDVSVRFGEEGGISILYQKLVSPSGYEPTFTRPPRLPFLTARQTGVVFPPLRPCTPYLQPQCHHDTHLKQLPNTKVPPPQTIQWLYPWKVCSSTSNENAVSKLVNPTMEQPLMVANNNCNFSVLDSDQAISTGPQRPVRAPKRDINNQISKLFVDSFFVQLINLTSGFSGANKNGDLFLQKDP
uniref:Anti-proliferative protein domain-containing protein n=1 Tax=Romanomermis culicivorax TaxID=13658 RepID=A0A915L4Y5_ROMCU